MLLSGRCCSQIFALKHDTVEDVLHECAHLLGLDEAEVLGSATLMHGTSVVTDLEDDLEAVTANSNLFPSPSSCKYLFLVGSRCMFLRKGCSFWWFPVFSQLFLWRSLQKNKNPSMKWVVGV